MIQKPTAFVLGAGASMEFDFPSGYALTQMLAAPAWDDGLSGTLQSLVALGYPHDRLLEFSKALRLSGCMSVDAFLEHRPDLREIGKAAIAAALIPFEKPFALFSERRAGPTLYSLIWQSMNAKPSHFHQNKAHFITFNYDRSLEEYLHTAIRNLYNLPELEAREVVSRVDIKHVHGSLGHHPTRVLDDANAQARHYQPQVDRASVELAASAIRIIHEALDEDDAFAAAKETLASVDRIVFLGFGYDPTNVRRLDLKGVGNRKWISGSARGIPEMRRNDLTNFFGGQTYICRNDLSAVEFYRSFVQYG